MLYKSTDGLFIKDGTRAVYMFKSTDIPEVYVEFGDDTEFLKKRQIIWQSITAQIPRAYKIAWQFTQDVEDLVWGAGLDAIIRAHETWDSTRDTSLHTHVHSMIQFAYRSVFAEQKRHNALKIKRNPMIEDIESEDVELLYYLLDKIDPYYKYVLLLKYKCGLTHDELCVLLQCAKGTVTNHIKEGIRQCQNVVKAIGVL